MRFTPVAAFLAAIASVQAAPGAPFEARDTSVGLKYCTNANGAGTCDTVGAALDKCLNVPAAFNDKISSIFIYPAGYSCGFFINTNCGGDDFILKAGAYNTIPAKFNDNISSYFCFMPSTKA